MAFGKVSELRTALKGKLDGADLRTERVRHVEAVVLKRTKAVIINGITYLMLVALSFVFIYPLLYMISQALMQSTDVSDATVQWIPKKFSTANFQFAYKSLGSWGGNTYWYSFKNSMITSFGSAILQVASCSVVGYGFARYRFPGYSVCLFLVIFTFLVPPETILVPLYRFFSDLGWRDSYLPFLVPSAMGHGLKGALFVLIFIQFYRRMPAVLEEAARIDGAGPYRTYWTIMLPLAVPAMLVVFLFSVVWHWNDLFEPNIYLVTPKYFNLSQTLSIFNGQGDAQAAAGQMQAITQTIGVVPTFNNRIMAGALLTILPMLILYLFTQRYFVEGVEKTGITGE